MILSFSFKDSECENNWTFLLQPHGDNDSETSIESNTSDSGRGGSESDIHSSGGLSQCQELGKIRTHPLNLISQQLNVLSWPCLNKM